MEFFDRGGKRAVWVVHRRGGKDLTALHQTAKMMHRRRGMYWHIFPTAELARSAIWMGFRKDGKRIMDNVFPPELRKSPRAFLPNGEMTIELKCGSVWKLMGSDRIEVVGAGPIGVVFSEFAVAKPSTWDYVRPMLRESDGWAAFITTPRGNNHAKRLYDVAGTQAGWWRDVQTLYDTRAYDPERTIEEERAEGMPEALIRQEYLCDWSAANVGAVWGDLLEQLDKAGGLVEFPHEVDGVFTSWDLGISDSTSIWFWRLTAGGVDFIDHYESHGKPLSHYFDVIESKPYRYLKHWLPHDARARTLVTGSSVQDQFVDRFGGDSAIGPPMSLLDGIQAARWLLQQKTRFHPRCGEGIEALRAYHYEYDEDRKTFSGKPEHDWSSHTADAFRYAACVVKFTELATRKPPAAPTTPISVPADGSFSLENLFELRERDQRGRKRAW